MSARKAAPSGLKAAGKRLWDAYTDSFALEEHESALLVQAARTVDVCDDLEAIVKRDGPVVDSPQGLKAHPAVVELRQQRIALARLLADLATPGEDGPAPPRVRRGSRGSYAPRQP